jgi:excisionase family DNA binding protein
MAEHTRDAMDLLTVAEVAAELRCSKSTVRRALAEGKLPFFRLRGEHSEIRVPFHGLEELVRPALHRAMDEATAATSEVEA